MHAAIKIVLIKQVNTHLCSLTTVIDLLEEMHRFTESQGPTVTCHISKGSIEVNTLVVFVLNN